jgi:chromate transporter
MERELVQGRKWVTKDKMREAIAVCQSLPGPLAIQVGILLSYLRGGFWGAWAGGWAFIFPTSSSWLRWRRYTSISAAYRR